MRCCGKEYDEKNEKVLLIQVQEMHEVRKKHVQEYVLAILDGICEEGILLIFQRPLHG
jgi:hypothetical protein